MSKEQKKKAFSLVRKPEGFTLIELLVVIAILVILMAALFLVINPVRLLQNSRNARRMEELGELNKAISASLANSDIAYFTDTTPSNSCTTGATWGVVGGVTTGWLSGYSGTLSNFVRR